MNTSHRAPPNSQISSPNINRSSSGETNRGRRALGGRLKVAGVVVGSWGASHSISQQNYDTAQPYLLGSSQVKQSCLPICSIYICAHVQPYFFPYRFHRLLVVIIIMAIDQDQILLGKLRANLSNLL